MTVANFTNDLAEEKVHNKEPIWSKLIQHFWPGSTIDDNDNITLQKQGVDTFLLRHGEKTLVIDKKRRKVREDGRAWDDILLEYWSDEDRIEGWAVKKNKTDYYLYLNYMNNTCQKIPAEPLRLALEKYLEEWLSWSKPRRVPNFDHGREWTTMNVPVDKDELDAACKEFGEGIEDIRLSDLEPKQEKPKRPSNIRKVKDIFQ